MAFASLNGVYSKESSAYNIKDFIERTITKIEIPRGVSRIGPGAFQGCTGVTGTVTVPDSVKRIEMEAFSDCEGISELKLPRGLEYIGGNAFVGTLSLERLVLPPLITSLYSTMARGSGIREFVAEGAIVYIAGAVFSDCTKCLKYDFTACTSVPPLSNVNAFGGINPEARIFVPASLYDKWIVATNWAAYAEHIVGVGAGNYGTLEYMLSGDSYRVVGIGSYDSMGEMTDLIIPDEHEGLPVTAIESRAFEGNSDLRSVSIPEGIVSIGEAAFGDCANITDIYYGAEALSSGEAIFTRAGQGGDGIRVVIGSRVEILPAKFLYGGYPMGSYSPKVVELEFEEGSVCRTIGDHAFYYCTLLDRFVAPASLEQIGTEALYSFDELDFSACRQVPTLKSSYLTARTIYVPAALYGEWVAATNWAQYADKIVGK